MNSPYFIKFFLLITLPIPFSNAFAQTSVNEPFKQCNIDGSITLYDYNEQKWISNDLSKSQYATLPASTFKIINTLIVLETGAIEDENEIVTWHGNPDTTKYGYRPDIYHDMNLKEAFEVSAGWVYVELAKKVGKDRYRNLLEKSNYGNGDVSIDDPDFWNFGDFAISPVNQIHILKGVYEETLPFSKRSFEILKRIMIQEQTEDYTLRAKTGWTRDGGKDTGWWVGYIERKDNIYFFATRLIKDRSHKIDNFGECRITISRGVLRQLEMI